MSLRSRVFFLLAWTALSCTAVCHVWAEDAVPERKFSPSYEPGVNGFPADRQIAAFQRDLLDLAFDTATAIPVRPHIKDRSRTQEAVVATCLLLDQPRRAQGYIEMIDNWRRGAGYADLAFYYAQHGKTHNAQHYLELAAQIARAPDVAAWRRDRIRVKIAQTHTWLGQARQAERFAAGVVESETGKVARVQAARSNEDAFGEQVKTLDALIEAGQFDITKNALEAYAALYDRFYNDAKRRSQVEEKIKTSLGKQPVFFQIELLMTLAGSALDHTDQAEALEQVNEAQASMDAHRWPARFGIPLAARLAALRFRAGDAQKARTNADAALAQFAAIRSKTVDIDRAGTLRPLAEAYQAMGDPAAALAVYRRAVEEGVKNPNSRPRAEDLSATCRSMALHDVEPDATLWVRMRQIRAGLGPPW